MYPQKILWTKQRQLSQTWEHFLQKIRKFLAHFQKKTIQSINFSKKLWLLKKFHQTRWKKFWRRTWKTFIKILNIVWSKAENIHPKKTLQKNPKKFLFFQKEIKQRRQNVFVRSPNSCSSLKLIAKNLKHVPKLLETSPRLVEGKFDKPRGRFFFPKKMFLDQILKLLKHSTTLSGRSKFSTIYFLCLRKIQIWKLWRKIFANDQKILVGFSKSNKP